MGDLSYWITVAETAGLFIAWTFACAILVMTLEYGLRKAFGRETNA